MVVHTVDALKLRMGVFHGLRSILLMANLQMCFTDVYYQTKSHKVFMTSWDLPMVSDDDGLTWHNWDSGDKNGIVFSTGSTGIASMGGESLGNPTLVGPSAITSDAGQTWQEIFNSPEGYEECWGPLAIPNTQIYFEASDWSGAIHKSVDGGLNWNTVLQLTLTDSPYVRATGSMEIDECGMIYLPTVLHSVYISQDTGANWIHLPSFGNQYTRLFADTRFSVRDGYLYLTAPAASLDPAENLLTYLWRLDMRQLCPLIESAGVASSICGSDTGVVHFHPIWTCDDTSSTFLGAEIRGSGSFRFLSPSVAPRRFNGLDSLVYLCNPERVTPDTSYLDLRFSMGGVQYDTLIPLIGQTNNPVNHPLDIWTEGHQKQDTASAGSVTPIYIRTTGPIQADLIHVTLNFDGNVLTPIHSYHLLHRGPSAAKAYR